MEHVFDIYFLNEGNRVSLQQFMSLIHFRINSLLKSKHWQCTVVYYASFSVACFVIKCSLLRYYLKWPCLQCPGLAIQLAVSSDVSQETRMNLSSSLFPSDDGHIKRAPYATNVFELLKWHRLRILFVRPTPLSFSVNRLAVI